MKRKKIQIQNCVLRNNEFTHVLIVLVHIEEFEKNNNMVKKMLTKKIYTYVQEDGEEKIIINTKMMIVVKYIMKTNHKNM